jgi:hypothetical protein
MARQHPERCKPCKNRILDLLKHIYGDVREEYGPGLAADVKGYSNTNPHRAESLFCFNTWAHKTFPAQEAGASWLTYGAEDVSIGLGDTGEAKIEEDADRVMV